MNTRCLWVLLVGQAVTVVRNARADMSLDEDGLAEPEAKLPSPAEMEKDDEGEDIAQPDKALFGGQAEPKRANWLPKCAQPVDRPELQGDASCRLALTVKRTTHWGSSDSHELYVRGEEKSSDALVAKADGFTKLKKKVTIKYTSKGSEYEATLKRGYCKAKTHCKLVCKTRDGEHKTVDEIVNAPVDAVTYTLCDMSGKRGPTMFKMFYHENNPKLDTIVRTTFGVYGSVKPRVGTYKGEAIWMLPFQVGEIRDLFPSGNVVKSSIKNGLLTDGQIDPNDPSRFIPKPDGENRYMAQNIRGKHDAAGMYFVDAHNPLTALDAFAYSLVMSDNSAV